MVKEHRLLARFHGGINYRCLLRTLYLSPLGTLKTEATCSLKRLLELQLHYILLYLFIKLQLGFSPVAVVQQ
jgi:hypothetical protein